MKEPIFKKVKGNGVEINVATWECEGTPILCIHGITANARCWDVMVSELNPKHTVHAMDLRGRGHSGRPASGYSLDHHIADILGVLDELGIERCPIIGHSLGAFITLGFAATHPDRVEKIVLVDGAGELSPAQLDSIFVAIKPAFERLGKVFDSTEAYLEAMQQSPYFQWSDAYDTYFRHEIKNVGTGAMCNIELPHIMEEAANLRTVKVSDFYSQVHCPTLILKATDGLLSDEDLLLPESVVEGMVQNIEKAQRFDVEGTNHYEIVFQPHQGRDQALDEFLSNDFS